MNRFDDIKYLGRELVELTMEIEQQDYVIAQLEICAAEYKAYFFGRSELAQKLSKQKQENRDNRVGEFDGFCYASWRAKAVFRTLDKMERDGLITKEEFEFCRMVI